MMKMIPLTFGLMISTSSAFAETGAKWMKAPVMSVGYVSITFDDATTSQFTAAYPILDAVGITPTLYVNSGPLDKGDGFYMSWDQIRILHAAGWEIGAHTVTHTALPTQNDVMVVGELVLSRDRIETEVGERPRSFASPFGEYDERTLSHIDRYFESHVRAWGNQGGVNFASVDPLLIERVNVDVSLTAKEICGKVQNVGSGEWLVLMFHQVAEPSGPYISTPSQLAEIAQCIKKRSDQKAIVADTVSAVIRTLQLKEEK
jgi:peptidoglycan/xylan/chitin deacetylase (PgdA/CDA1 family)